MQYPSFATMVNPILWCRQDKIMPCAGGFTANHNKRSKRFSRRQVIKDCRRSTHPLSQCCWRAISAPCWLRRSEFILSARRLNPPPMSPAREDKLQLRVHSVKTCCSAFGSVKFKNGASRLHQFLTILRSISEPPVT